MAGGDANGHVPAKRAHRHPCVGNTLRAVWAPWSSGDRQTMEVNSSRISRKSMKADSTLRTSRAVPHPSTNRALCRLTSEVERDPVHSTRYGRQRKHPKAAKAPKNRVFFSPPRHARGRSPPALAPTDVGDRHRPHRDDHGGGGHAGSDRASDHHGWPSYDLRGDDDRDSVALGRRPVLPIASPTGWGPARAS
jgi:hypothetical protein